MRATHSGLILEALKSGRQLTALEALDEFGCFRLAARIHDLRKAGHNVLDDMITTNGKRHAVYRLAMPARQARLF